MSLPLPVVYRDEHLIAVIKPPGLLVHRSEIDRHETDFALQRVRDQIGQRVFPLHRLDRPTSGVLLFGLDSDTARRMGQQLMQHQFTKQYRAIVRGHVRATGQIDYALRYKWDKYADGDRVQAVPPQPAVTSYHPLAHYTLPWPVGRYDSARFTLLAMSPHSGRKHQLRRHMAHIRHPIVGDTTHGDGKQNRYLREHCQYHHLALCCVEMSFVHPYSQQWTTITSPDLVHLSPLLAQWSDYQVGLG